MLIVFLFSIDFILFSIFAAGYIVKKKKKKDQILVLHITSLFKTIITVYCNTFSSVLIPVTYKGSLAQPEQPEAQPEVLSRALLVVARTRLVTKGDRAFAVRAPKVCK